MRAETAVPGRRVSTGRVLRGRGVWDIGSKWRRGVAAASPIGRGWCLGGIEGLGVELRAIAELLASDAPGKEIDNDHITAGVGVGANAPDGADARARPDGGG
jgi:hypothetical protein